MICDASTPFRLPYRLMSISTRSGRVSAALATASLANCADHLGPKSGQGLLDVSGHDGLVFDDGYSAS